MPDTVAERILDRQAALQSQRANFDSLWQQVSERVLPGSATFNTIRTPGEGRTERMFDATASLALKKYSAIIESMSTPRNSKWHRLVAANEKIAELPHVKQFFDEFTKRLFKRRYAPAANFAGQSGSVNLELGGLGNSALFIDEDPQTLTVRYRAIPLSQFYIVENHVGFVDTLYRRYPKSAEAAVKEWGDRCPEKIRQAADKRPDEEFWFIHCVRPIADVDDIRVPQGTRFASYYVSETGRVRVQEAGYFTFPYAIARDLTASGEIYGRSPAVWMLPDIKMLNEMNRTVIRAGHKLVDPPVLFHEDGALAPFSQRPGAANYGMLDAQGRPLAQPFETKARLDYGIELMQMKQTLINEAFHINLFQILIEEKKMTATEVLERAQEKGMLLGPLAGRQQSEYLGPLVEREIDIAIRAGEAPPIPRELIETGGGYDVLYESPMARAQRAEEGVAILRTFDAVAPLAELRPDIFDNFDLDETVRTLGEVNGMEAKLFMDREQMQVLRQQRAEQQQAAAMAELAPGVAKGAKDLASIGQQAA